MFRGRHRVDVVLVPPPPAQPEVAAACADADLVIADRRHKHRIDRIVLEQMRRCRLIQQAAVGFDSIDHRAAAEHGIPVANAAGYNRESVADWTVMAMAAAAEATAIPARVDPVKDNLRTVGLAVSSAR